jgi:ubiquitin fusion degradation protein 1
MFGWGNRNSFLQHYRVFPCSFIEKPENGNKVYLPPSALNRLAQLQIEYPMLFRAENRRTGKYTHCGVLEFVADEGSVYIPYWMMCMLGLSEGDVLTVSNVSLPKGSYVKLQPHSTAFIDIANPRAVLERTLRNYSCLTTGDTIAIPYNDQVYDINIVETRPSDAISVVETDVNVDFAPPLDYQEPSSSAPPSRATSTAASTGVGTDKSAPATEGGDVDAAGTSEDGENTTGFMAFQGVARRLDGKPAAPAAPAAAPLGQARPPPAREAPKMSKKKSGKLMFKDRLAAKFEQPRVPGAPPATEKKPTTMQGDADKDADKDGGGFKPFEGRGYSLK